MGVPDPGDPLFAAAALRPVLKGAPIASVSAAPAPAAHRENAVGMALGHLPCGVVWIDAEPGAIGSLALGRGLAPPQRDSARLGRRPVHARQRLGRISGGFIIFRVSPYAMRRIDSRPLLCCSRVWRLSPNPRRSWFWRFWPPGSAPLSSEPFFSSHRGRHRPTRWAPCSASSISFANLGAAAFTLLFGWSKDSLGSFAWGFAVLCPLAAAALLAGWRGLGREKPA